MAVPRAKKINHTVHFGVNPDDPDDNRGEAPMDPPLEHEDPYFWLRYVPMCMYVCLSVFIYLHVYV